MRARQARKVSNPHTLYYNITCHQPLAAIAALQSAVMRKTLFLLSFFCSAIASPAVADDNQVIATIAPLHSLVSAVMDGVGTPRLIVPGNQSPHTFSLKPSDAQAIQDARLVFWIGPGLESALKRPLVNLANNARIVKLSTSKGITVLPLRGHGDHDDHAHGQGSSRQDLHLWLSPRNAVGITEIVTQELSKTFASQAGKLAENGRRTIARLRQLGADLRSRLTPHQGAKFAVFHDSLQYLEHEYGLMAPVVINPNPESRPSAAQVRKVRAQIRRSRIRCVFAEPHLTSQQIEVYLEGTSAVSAIIDPVGSGLPPGKEHYFDMMQGLADQMASCLAPRVR